MVFVVEHEALKKFRVLCFFNFDKMSANIKLMKKYYDSRKQLHLYFKSIGIKTTIKSGKVILLKK